MKTTKKAVSLLLSLLMVFTTLFGTGVTAFADEADILSYIKYEYSSSQFYSGMHITDCDTSLSGDVVLPDTIEGYPVTYIKNSAFSGCHNITSVTIPDSVKIVSNSAFSNCNGLKSVTVGAGVTSMSSAAFGNALERIEVSERNTKFSSDEYGIVYNKDKTSLLIYPASNRQTVYTIPATVTSIKTSGIYEEVEFSDNLMFIDVDRSNTVYSNDSHGVLFNKDKTKLIKCPKALIDTEYTIPDGVTSMSEGAFYGCDKLEKVTLGNDMTSTGKSSFFKCTSLSDVEINGNITAIDDFSFYGCTGLESFDVPESIETVGNYAFAYCENLETVTIPDSVTTIGENVFRECKSLKDVTLGKNAVSIGKSTFYNCSSLEQISLPEGTKTISPYLFYSCTSITGFTIPESVEVIDAYAFSYSGLTTISFPAKVTTLGSDAFTSTGLTSVTIPGNIKEISSAAFYNCHKLKNVTISEGVTTVADYAFQNCSTLEKITFPSSVTSIGSGALSMNSKLSDVTFLNPDCTIKDSAFTIADTATIHGYAGSTAESYATTYSRTFAVIEDKYETFEYFTYEVVDGAVTILACDKEATGEIIIPEVIGEYPVNEIGENAFDGCVNVTAVTFNDAEVEIFDSEATIPANITINGHTGSTAESYAVKYSRSFVSVDEAEVVKHLEYRISDGEVTIRGYYPTISGHIVLPETIEGYPVTAIGLAAFFGCETITGVVIPESVTDIGANAFHTCKNLETAVLPDNLTELKKGAFYGCSALKIISLPENLTAIGEQAFRGCSSLESIEIPGSVKSIGDLAFDSCQKLASIILNEGLQTIGADVFLNCYELSEITIPDSVTAIGENAFGSCRKLANVTIGKGLSEMGDDAFRNAGVVIFAVDEENDYYSNDQYGVLFNKDKTLLIQYPKKHTRTSYDIPDTVTQLAPYAFVYASGLKSVTIPDCIKTISNYAFFSASALREIVVPEGVEAIGQSAFQACSLLKNVTLAESVKLIEKDAFAGCHQLEKITILNSECEIYDNESTIHSNAVISAYSDSTAEAYATKYSRQFEALIRTGVSENLAYKVVDDSVIITGFEELVIGSVFIPAEIDGLPVAGFSPELFAGNVTITTVVLPDTVKEIEDDSFRGCSALKKVVATNVETIGNNAFAVCKILDTVISFSDTLEISDNAFEENENLSVFVKDTASVTAPETLNVITFSFADGTLSFSGEYKSDLYYLFDLVAVMCSYYDGVQYLFFDTFEAVSADDGHIYFYTEDWQRIALDGERMTNVKFSLETFNGGEIKKYSFNELCEKVASGELDNFNLVIEEADGVDKGSVEIMLVDQLNMVVQRFLKALTNLLNKLFSFFKAFGK